MAGAYLGFKEEVRKIIGKHFPPEISVRFTLRSDSEVWIPKEDESVYNKWKSGTESVHIFFDGLPLFEIPQKLDPRFAELFFLRAFKQAIIDGRIHFAKRIEWSDNETARRNKQGIAKKKSKKLKDAIGYGLQNPMSTESAEKVILDQKHKVVKLKGGE